MKREDEVVISLLSRSFFADGRNVKINIYRGLEIGDEWLLEIIDSAGGITVANTMFPTDQAALDAAICELHL